MIPQDYKVQDGCWSCEYCVDNSTMECVLLYCSYGDMYVPEIPEYGDDISEWIKWANDAREVRISGKCACFKRKQFALPY